MNYFCRHGQVPLACIECYREAEAPPSEINDKTGWVYDPGQALANLRRAEAAEKRVAELEAEATRKPSADEREKFETWCASRHWWKQQFGWMRENGLRRREDGEYEMLIPRGDWETWQAAREVSQHPEPAPQITTNELLEGIRSRLGEPKVDRIPAIKWVRDITGWGLVESRDYVLKVVEGEHPEPAPKETRLLGMNETELANIELGEHPGPAPQSEYQVDRYRNGRKMAEGAKVTATSANEALEKARKLFYPLAQGETFVIAGEHPEPAPQCLCTTEPANPAEDNFLPVRVTNKRCPEHGEHSEPAKGGGQ